MFTNTWSRKYKHRDSLTRYMEAYDHTRASFPIICYQNPVWQKRSYTTLMQIHYYCAFHGLQFRAKFLGCLRAANSEIEKGPEGWNKAFDICFKEPIDTVRSRSRLLSVAARSLRKYVNSKGPNSLAELEREFKSIMGRDLRKSPEMMQAINDPYQIFNSGCLKDRGFVIGILGPGVSNRLRKNYCADKVLDQIWPGHPNKDLCVAK